MQPQDLTATVFHCLGVPPDTEMVDAFGRPLPVSRGEVIRQVGPAGRPEHSLARRARPLHETGFALWRAAAPGGIIGRWSALQQFGGVFASLQHGPVQVSVMEPTRDQSVRPPPGDAESAPSAPGFESTPWSVVLRAQDGTAPQARAALATLCQIYWYPLYTYIRRRSASADEAEELTQEFFTRFLEKDFVNGAEQARGKFRTFLLACCKHFLANERRHARALKRGGGETFVPLDVEAARQRYILEPADTLTAEKLFDRQWAVTLLEQCLDQLGQAYQGQDQKALYDELKGYLVGDSGTSSYAEVAGRLGMTEGAVKKAAQRLRERYGTLVRKQIRATVESPEQVEDEIRELFDALGG